MSRLLTKNPIAIRQLMNEAIFSLHEEAIAPTEAIVPTETVKEEETPLIFWGENKANIVFFVKNELSNYFSVEAEDAFLKTLSALTLSLNEVAVVNLEKSSHSFEQIKAQLNPKFCVYLEGNTSELTESFNTFMDEGNMKVLHTYSFEEMLTETTKKRMFWNGIKEITTFL